jgi:AraC family transcriptional regulator of adaptative response/methylated-DNA-[protein]-cysteine methyltransferase
MLSTMETSKKATNLQIRYVTAPSYLGWVLVVVSDQGICAIDLGDSPEDLEKKLPRLFPGARFTPGGEELTGWSDKVRAFLESPDQRLDLPLDMQGTAFQQRVWAALQAIPSGTTISYRELATRIGNPKSVRATATACASNRIAVAIPCHRVVRSDGSLGGYRWGLERKRKLLERENELARKSE